MDIRDLGMEELAGLLIYRVNLAKAERKTQAGEELSWEESKLVLSNLSALAAKRTLIAEGWPIGGMKHEDMILMAKLSKKEWEREIDEVKKIKKREESGEVPHTNLMMGDRAVRIGETVAHKFLAIKGN